jgi:hypothetical protein
LRALRRLLHRLLRRVRARRDSVSTSAQHRSVRAATARTGCLARCRCRQLGVLLRCGGALAAAAGSSLAAPISTSMAGAVAQGGLVGAQRRVEMWRGDRRGGRQVSFTQNIYRCGEAIGTLPVL